MATHTHTESHTVAQWAVPFNVTRWRVLVCDLVTSNRMIIEKKGINGFSTNNNRRLHLKMQARGVKHNRTLYVLRQQRKGRGVTMVSTNNNKKSSWKQVRRSDQLRYPIHNRSFIAHGRFMNAVCPCIYYKRQKSRLLSIRTCWLCVFGTDCDTHKPPTVGLFSTHLMYT